MTEADGQYFRLSANTLAVDNEGSKPVTVDVPAGSIILATGARNSDDPRMIEIRWQGFRLFMFVIDVQERGEKVMSA